MVMVRKLFGTDGIRGVANIYPLTPDVIIRIAQAAGLEFQRGDHRHIVVIGKDTRLSGYMVESALTAGFISVGMDVVLVGPMPTPAVAMLTRSLRADLGVVISASHNLYKDNGIKLFGPDGYKLSDQEEAKIEARIHNFDEKSLVAPDHLATARRLEDAAGRYIEYVKNTFPRHMRLDGLKIVIDCGNGAAYKIAPRVLWELGAEIIPLGVSPDGVNINQDCGATSTEKMRSVVIEHRADIGISLDGDADRIMIADEKGQLIDGDQLLAVIATSWHNLGLLKKGGVVATVMSNIGLERYLESLGLTLIRTQVGDRYVMDYMKKHAYNLGGEQSGHVILGDYISTGDGLITALQMLSILIESGLPASQVARPFVPSPQVLKNIKVRSSKNMMQNEQVQKAIIEGEKLLKETGRLLVRKSGTEPLIRVMAEGDDPSLISYAVDQLLSVIQEQDALNH
jgi:phosphoglucosamine mutase